MKRIGVILLAVFLMLLLPGCDKETERQDKTGRGEEPVMELAPEEVEAPEGYNGAAGEGRVEESSKELVKNSDEAVEELIRSFEEAKSEGAGPEENEEIKDPQPETLDETDPSEEEKTADGESEEESTGEEDPGDPVPEGEGTGTAEAEGAGEETAADASPETPVAEQSPAPAAASGGNRIIYIDAGHQGKGNNEKEPIGPGASQTKAKVAGGTTGVATGKPEYQLTLEVALKLQAALAARGYDVRMVRTSNDVNISNAERAQMANAAGAAAFIRLHANGAGSSAAHGAQTICQSPSNPYNASLYSQSRKLSGCVLDSFVAATGCKKEYVSERDDMSGINWCQTPVTILEMGYMTNPAEDANMSDAAYQQKMVEGIANGIDAYFK